MHVDPAHSRGRYQPAGVTLPALLGGNVRACLATIFTEAQTDPDDPEAETGAHAYPIGDAEAAHRAGLRQLKLYHAWRDAGVIDLMARRHSGAPPPCLRAAAPSCLLTGLLMECADPVVEPDDLDWWADQGVVAIGMAWWHQSRYAGGNGVETGLTDLGRALVPRMDDLGIVHDASHLSDRSLRELLDLTDAPVIATHSNCRALMGTDAPVRAQRHLADETIMEIARREGVIGLNLYRRFIAPDLGDADRPSIDDAVAHVEHVCDLAGDRAHVGLGSDMDGGLTANDLPEGIDRPANLSKLTDALAARSWSDDDVHAFAWRNWARFWGLPEEI